MIRSYGYMTVLTNNIYYGFAVNGSDKTICNGALMRYDPETMNVTIPSPEHFVNTELEIVEETVIYSGLPALRIKVNAVDDLICFVDNQVDYNSDYAYETYEYSSEPGAMMRIHPLDEGDEFVVGPYEKPEGTQSIVGNKLKVADLNALYPQDDTDNKADGWMIIGTVGTGDSSADVQALQNHVARIDQQITVLQNDNTEMKQNITDLQSAVEQFNLMVKDFAKKNEVLLLKQNTDDAGKFVVINDTGNVQLNDLQYLPLVDENGEKHYISVDPDSAIIVSVMDD